LHVLEGQFFKKNRPPSCEIGFAFHRTGRRYYEIVVVLHYVAAGGYRSPLLLRFAQQQLFYSRKGMNEPL